MKLHVENFAKIKEADIEINGITVIAGENNTGKSLSLIHISMGFVKALDVSGVKRVLTILNTGYFSIILSICIHLTF